MAAKTTQSKKNKKTLDLVQVKAEFQRHEKDTGSSEVQIVLLSEEIVQLQSHLESHRKDFDAKRCLLRKVATRRKFLKYLKTKNIDTYNIVSKRIDLKV